MSRLSIPKAPANKPKTIKVKDLIMPDRNAGNIPSLKRSSAPKRTKNTYTPVPKDTFGKMQPSMQTAFQVLGTADLLNQDFMKKPLLLPQVPSFHSKKESKKGEVEKLLSDMI